MPLKKFTTFVTEKQTDEELKTKMEKDLASDADSCPRCGRPFVDCTCPTTDYFSTMNIYRTPKGEIKKS